MQKKRTLRLSLALTTASACIPAAAMAASQNTDPSNSNQSTSTASTSPAPADIVVTAQRRTEKARDVPISITTLNSQQLAIANVNQLSDTAKITPGLRFDSQGSFVQPTIRGVGTAISTSGGGPNVGIYVDGFFQSNPEAADFQLMRVENIQVLKGPQGTLFGRNTTGGAILVTTADPSTTPSTEFRGTFGRFRATTIQGYSTFGLSDKVAMDVEANYRYGDGFTTNTINGDSHVGQFRDWLVRTGIKADLSDKVSVMFRYMHSDTNDPSSYLTNAFVDKSGSAGFFDKVSPAGQAIYGHSSSKGLPLIYYYSPAGTFSTDPDKVSFSQPVGFRNKSDVFQGTIKADLGFANLTSYTQYRRDDALNLEHLDPDALNLFSIRFPVVDRTVSQEFLLSSQPGTRLQWTAGLNYFRYRDTWTVNAAFGGSPFFPFSGSTTLTTSYAAFADATYRLSDHLFITGGVRYSRDIVSDASFILQPGATSYQGPDGQPIPATPSQGGSTIPINDLKNSKITPRVVIRYKPNAYSSIYASYTQGYKAGILNASGESQLPVKAERINAYEAGYKFGNNIFNFDFAGFYYRYKDLQVSSFQAGTSQITNAASAKIYGIEAQSSLRIGDHLNVFGGIAWTHARYQSFKNAPFYSYCDPAAAPASSLACGPIGPGSLVQTTTDASGDHMQRAPELTGNIGASYTQSGSYGKITLSGNYHHTSSFYFDPEQQFKQNGYGILSLRAEWQDISQHITLAVFGDNVTNKRYMTQVLFNTLGIGAVHSAPATWGVSAGFKF